MYFPFEAGLSSDDVQREIRRVLATLGPLAEGVELNGVGGRGLSIGTTAVRVAHDLGRVPRGWIEISPSSADRVRNSQAPDASFLYLIAPSALTAVKVWVY